MNPFSRFRLGVLLALGAAFVVPSSAQNESWPLARSFEKLQAIQLSLAADDYIGAKELAPALLEAGKAEITRHAPKFFSSVESLSTVDSLQKARDKFANISGKFSNITETFPNNGGYYTCICTSVPGNLQFVQREKDITHCPYGGRANPTCGRVQSVSR